MNTTQCYDVRLDEDRLPYLIRECTVVYPDNLRSNSPGLISKWIGETLDLERRSKELLVLICFDIHFMIIGFSIISIGTVDTACASPREIFQTALAVGANKIVLVHNHPSGDPQPSKSDMDILELVKRAGEIIEIELTDFIITGRGIYYSAREHDRF